MISPDENGLFHGYLFLAEKLPEGDYTLRAYTRYMENMGDDYFFKKNIRISPLPVHDANRTVSDGAPQKTALQPLPVPPSKKNLDYEVTFYPEGGNFPEGIFSRVAFKAINQQGESEGITGEIVDNKDRKIADVSTVFAGMGSFTFIPEPDATYFLVCCNNRGLQKRFKLPVAKRTYTLNINYRDHRHYIQVKKTPNLPERSLYLLIHCKGKVFYFAPWNYHDDNVSISTKLLPSGVIQVVLFDEQMNPVSERLIFNKNNMDEKLAFHTDKTIYGKREKVNFTIMPFLIQAPKRELETLSLSERDGEGLHGHFSIAITDDKDMAIDSLNTITSSLLLSSELKGYIEAPGYYLQDDPQAELALDHLMMTHGWRRYEWSDVLTGNHIRPSIFYEVENEISGHVRTSFRGKPVADGEVTLFTDEGNAVETKTDAFGKFHFSTDFPDSTRFIVQAMNQKGNDNVELLLDDRHFPALKHAPVCSLFLPAYDQNHLVDYAAGFFNKAKQRAGYDEDIRVVNLEEVVVTARNVKKIDEERLRYKFNAFSDQTVYRESFAKRSVTNVSQLLINISGVKVDDLGRVLIRQNTAPPLIVIDGIEYLWQGDNSPLELLSADEVESIDVFKSVAASNIYGVKGAYGVISITTRRTPSEDIPRDVKANIKVTTPLGYQRPVEYYAPRYDTPQSKESSIPDYRTTIFWKPDIVVSDGKETSFDFFTADFPTTYSVVIEGITADGRMIRQVEKIRVE